MAGVSLAEALTMATVNPGRFVGGRGILQRGSPADLIQFTLDEAAMALCIVTVVVGGKICDLAGDSSK